MIHPSTAAAIAAIGPSQYSESSGNVIASSRYYDFNDVDSELTASPRRISEYRGWDRESDLHSVPFGMRGKESHRLYASPIVGSSRGHTKDEPLVPKPTFVRPTSAAGGSGGGSSSAYPSAASSILISPPTSVNHPSASATAHFSIAAHELYSRESKVFPNGSPYHRLREYRSDQSVHARGASFEGSNRRRPVSAHLTDSSDTFLDWSADTIVRRRPLPLPSLSQCPVCFVFV